LLIFTSFFFFINISTSICAPDPPWLTLFEYDCLKDIPSKRLEHRKLWVAVAISIIQYYLVGGVIESARHWSEVSLSPLTKKSSYIVEYLVDLESIFDKYLTRGPGAQQELYDKKQRQKYQIEKY
jgi:hypothetical protein